MSNTWIHVSRRVPFLFVLCWVSSMTGASGPLSVLASDQDPPVQPGEPCTDLRPWICGGGEAPTPFDAFDNRTGELADGEVYTLIGKVTAKGMSGDVSAPGDRPFLEISFKAHPWLATERRLTDSQYPIECDWKGWEKFTGKFVKIVARAKGIISYDAASRKFVHTLWLSHMPDTSVDVIDPPKASLGSGRPIISNAK